MSLAPADPYVREFEAELVSAGSEVVLTETYFYPEGGGQPADRGTVAGVPVEHVRTADGRVVHELAEPAPAGVGDRVSCAVDGGVRTYCMRAHTASHVLYGAGRRLLEGLGYGGFDIGERKVRVDLEATTPVDDETLVKLERLVNRAVWDSRDVAWERLPREEALSREDVAFNAATEEGVGGESVRVVTVGRPGHDTGDGPDAPEGVWDIAACGGTHVGNTREIGPVTVLGRSNPGEGATRVEFAVGPAAIERRAERRRAGVGAARALETNPRALPEAVERLLAERDDLAAERDRLREAVVTARLSELRESVVERDGRTWLAGTVDLDANALADRAGDLAGEAADVVALVAPGGDRLAVAATDGVDASAVVGEVTDAFGGGGGGSPAVAQAGGLDADAGALVDHLRGDRGGTRPAGT